MAQLLHGRATTTPSTRQVFQQSTESATVLARRYHVNGKTVRKWGLLTRRKKRTVSRAERAKRSLGPSLDRVG